MLIYIQLVENVNIHRQIGQSSTYCASLSADSDERRDGDVYHRFGRRHTKHPGPTRAIQFNSRCSTDTTSVRRYDDRASGRIAAGRVAPLSVPSKQIDTPSPRLYTLLVLPCIYTYLEMCTWCGPGTDLHYLSRCVVTRPRGRSSQMVGFYFIYCLFSGHRVQVGLGQKGIQYRY